MSIKKQELRQYVLNLLENYASMQKKIALLRYELEHPATISAEEMINSMAFTRGDDVGRSEGMVSNKTMYIAMNYHQQAARLNQEVSDSIAQRLIPLENEVSRLHYYVDLMDSRFSQIIQFYYFEKKSWDEIADEAGCAVRTAQNLRKQAVDSLIETYEFVQGQI